MPWYITLIIALCAVSLLFLKRTGGNTEWKEAPPSRGWFLFVVGIPAVTTLVGLTWIVIFSYQRGLPLPGGIWIVFAMGLAALALFVYLYARRARRPD